MSQNNLYDLIQNTAISTIALHSFTLGFNNIAKHKESEILFPKLEYMFYVLPIVYNHSSMETFKTSNELYSVLIKNNAIVLGLQERANKKMSKQTFDGLNLGFSKKILTYNKNKMTIELLRGFQIRKLPLTLTMNTSYNSVKNIQISAFKLGAIFAKRNIENIQFELNIKF
jgi:hypothetical protein